MLHPSDPWQDPRADPPLAAEHPSGCEGLGTRLRETRRNVGLSQSQLAARSGIPKPRLSRYENGHILPSVPTLTRLSYALGVPPDALLAHDETPVEAFTRTLQQRGFQFRTVEEACALAHEIADRAGGPRSR